MTLYNDKKKMTTYHPYQQIIIKKFNDKSEAKK